MSTFESAENSLKSKLLKVIQNGGLTVFDEPIRLASGNSSRYFIDCKQALSTSHNLRLAAEVIIQQLQTADIEFDTVGGPTLGADALSVAIALQSDTNWFIIRKETKQRGTNRLIEGTQISHNHRILLVDDVVTTGGSIITAYRQTRETGAKIAAAVTLVDRSDKANRWFTERHIPYHPIITYRDLRIPAIGNQQ